jgi:SAM-dependent methyltransferase
LPGSSESANKAHWESVGASYRAEWELPGKRVLSERELAFVARHLTESGVGAGAALDVGTGNGRILDRLLATAPDVELYGIDVAAAMLAVCQARFQDEPRVKELRACDISQDPVPFDRRFGFVSAIRVLKYSPTWPESVARLTDSLEPGGRFVFSMPNRVSANRLSRDYAVPWFQTSRRDLMALCERLGLRILEIAGFVRLPYLAYRRAGDGLPLKMLVGTENGLERLLGPTFLTRELFVAATTA